MLKMGDANARALTVQDFVRNILNAVTSLQSGSSVDNRSVERSRGVEFNSVNDEVNARFQIPRQARGISGRETETTNRASSSTAISNNFLRQSTTFNPRQNYSQTKVPAIRRARGRERKSSSSSRAVNGPDYIYKDVCLLPCPDWNHVPRSSIKANLVDRGLYIDAFQLDKNWDETRLYNELASLFENALKRQNHADIVIGFEFVKSTGSSIVPMNLPRGQLKNAKVVKHVSGQGPIYIRALEDLNDENDNKDSDSYNEQELHIPLDGHDRSLLAGTMHTPIVEGNATMSQQHGEVSAVESERNVPMPGTSLGDERSDAGASVSCSFGRQQQTISSYMMSGQDLEAIEQLQSMFPDIPRSQLESVYKNSIDVDDAVDTLICLSCEANCVSESSGCDLAVHLLTIMRKHRMTLIDDEFNRLRVERETLWEDSLVFFKGSKFIPNHTLRVTFSGEPGLDAGGVSREYGTLLVKAIFSSEAKLFEGMDSRKVPIYNADAVHSNLFNVAGKMCAYLVSHLDVSMPCLSPAIYEYIATLDTAEASKLCVLDDVPDYELRLFIQEVTKASTVQELQKVFEENDRTDSLEAAGWVRLLTLENKGLAMWQLMVHEVLLKRKIALDQFCTGLKILNFHYMVQQHSRQLKSYFVATEVPISAEHLLAQFKNLSIEESDERHQKAKEFLIRAVNDLEDQDSGKEDMKHFLQFLSSLDSLPPLGLETPITIRYKEDTSKTLQAETCTLTLVLPTVHDSYESFLNSFTISIREGYLGFGIV